MIKKPTKDEYEIIRTCNFLVTLIEETKDHVVQIKRMVDNRIEHIESIELVLKKEIEAIKAKLV